jgi:anti-sigma factor RsiW
MEHERIVEMLSAFHDGALDAAERETVSLHAAGCAQCAATLTDWESAAKAFFRRPPSPTPFQTEAFVARVMARVPAEDARFLAAALKRWLAPALGLGFAALAFSFSPYARDAGLDPASSLIASGPDRSGLSEWIARPGAPAADDFYGFDAEDR